MEREIRRMLPSLMSALGGVLNHWGSSPPELSSVPRVGSPDRVRFGDTSGGSRESCCGQPSNFHSDDLPGGSRVVSLERVWFPLRLRFARSSALLVSCACNRPVIAQIIRGGS